MNFSAYSIRSPIPAIMLFILLSIAGLLAFKSMAVQDFPDIDLPTVTVSAVLDGTAPAQMETEVARKIEDAVASLQGVRHIVTDVRDGTVSINVWFELEKNSAEAMDDVRNAVARVRADLPGEMRDPSITKSSTNGRAVLTLTAASERLDQTDLSWFVDNAVAKRLLVDNITAEAARFKKLLPAYQSNPDLFTQSRLIESMGRVFTNAQDKMFLPTTADGKPVELRLLLNREPPKSKMEEAKP